MGGLVGRPSSYLAHGRGRVASDVGGIQKGGLDLLKCQGTTTEEGSPRSRRGSRVGRRWDDH